MAFKEVKGRYDGPALEQEVLAFWRDHDTFEKTLQQTKGKAQFSFNEGPPTANGKPGIHHVLARSFKDIFPRYKTMRGYECRQVPSDRRIRSIRQTELLKSRLMPRRFFRQSHLRKEAVDQQTADGVLLDLGLQSSADHL